MSNHFIMKTFLRFLACAVLCGAGLTSCVYDDYYAGGGYYGSPYYGGTRYASTWGYYDTYPGYYGSGYRYGYPRYSYYPRGYRSSYRGGYNHHNHSRLVAAPNRGRPASAGPVRSSSRLYSPSMRPSTRSSGVVSPSTRSSPPPAAQRSSGSDSGRSGSRGPGDGVRVMHR